MTEIQATLHQLQRGDINRSDGVQPAEDYVHAVELGTENPFATGLRISGVLAFLLAFSVHQFYLVASVDIAVQAPDVAAEVSAESVIDDVETAVLAAGKPVNQGIAPDALLTPTAIVDTSALAQSDVLKNTERLEEQAEQARELNLLRQQQLELLYKNATIALSKDRLMTPQSDNAVHYFQAMLDIDSAEPRALSGLKKVAKRYKAFAVSLAKRGDITAAAQMLERAEALAPQTLRLGDLIAQMPAAQAADVDATAQPSGGSNQASRRTNAQEGTRVVRSVNGEIDDAKFLAKKQIANGQARDAAFLLSSFMPQYAADGEFVELLHQAYLNSNQSAEALNLRVTLQGTLPGHHMAKMQAAEFIQSARPNDAIAVLEKNLPSYEQDSSYYGLLAGLYYRVQRYADAEKAYEKLLGVAPDMGSYWLGYAVALDAQSNLKALGAFKKATLTLPAQDASRQYVEQRVRELGGGQ
ncbi:hypothetical protein R50072_22180 [Simiduia litorea]|uniref:hypothetical protein n=1 Tax=Simiduia litorea TaxID=1435348 RepID=UPI0036F3C006